MLFAHRQRARVRGRSARLLGQGASIGHTFNEPGKLWQNGKNESFNGKFRDECWNGERFASRREAKVVIEAYRRTSNEERPHRALGYATPAEARAR